MGHPRNLGRTTQTVISVPGPCLFTPLGLWEAGLVQQNDPFSPSLQAVSRLLWGLCGNSLNKLAGSGDWVRSSINKGMLIWFRELFVCDFRVIEHCLFDCLNELTFSLQVLQWSLKSLGKIKLRGLVELTPPFTLVKQGWIYVVTSLVALFTFCWESRDRYFVDRTRSLLFGPTQGLLMEKDW